MKKLTEFEQGYIECALWSSMDDSNDQGGEPLDQNYSITDIEPDTLDGMIKDCNEFIKANSKEIETALDEGADYSQLGHDFWLTRNRHGAGFWDRDYADELTREALSEAARKCGEVDLFINDNNQVEKY